MKNIFSFGVVALIVVIALYAILKILIKKFNPEKSHVRLYGIMQGMTTKEVISVSCFIISYIFLIYLMSSFIDVDLYIIVIVLFLRLVGDLLIKNKKILLNLLLELVSLGGLKIIYLIHTYITDEYMSVWLLLLLVFVMIFIFLYLSYTLLRSLNEVVLSNEYIRRGKNED